MNNTYSFKTLLEKEIVIDSKDGQDVIVSFGKIEIPIIQRDYAQGRHERKERGFVLNEAGKRFLDSIFSALMQKKEMKMDFIYGSIPEYTEGKTNTSTEYSFLPLDGQQRLTTLFLLYWYIGSRELEDEVEREHLMALLKKFTYSTRSSSRRFCELLCATELQIEAPPSQMITNLSWFFDSYKKDPTIKAMLNMLDAIHDRYTEHDNSSLFSHLEELQFYILPLHNFKLTEDLYIKMNARGKPLTYFENFKAELINWMENNEDANFKQTAEYNQREMPYYTSISQKIDNEWSHMFWKARNKDEDSIDPLFMNFIYRYFLNYYILSSKENDSALEITKDPYFKFFESEDAFQNFDVFVGVLDYNAIKTFEKIFDSLEQNWDTIEDAISPSWFAGKKRGKHKESSKEENNNEERYSFLSPNITQGQRAILAGITLFLEKNDNVDSVLFKQWMRIVWNIVENTDISDWSSAIGVMRLLGELSNHSSHIYKHLADPKIELTSKSSSIAMDEEKRKCSFLYSSNKFHLDWETAFIKAEEHAFFKGSVSFIMTENMELADFNHRAQLAEEVFDNNGVSAKYREKGHLFLRALLSKYTHYTQIIWKSFTDTDEKEHYLKKMLASDTVVQTATRDWFSLKNEEQLGKALKSATAKKSQIISWDPEDSICQICLRKVHEDLYQKEDLQNWMQQNKAIRLGWRKDNLYVSKPNTTLYWVGLFGDRNSIISRLLEKPYSCKTDFQCSVNDKKIPYFLGNDEVSPTREVVIGKHNVTFKYRFEDDVVSVGAVNEGNLKRIFGKAQFKKDEDWICKKEFNYAVDVTQEEDIIPFIKEIEKQVFGRGKDSLVSKMRSCL